MLRVVIGFAVVFVIAYVIYHFSQRARVAHLEQELQDEQIEAEALEVEAELERRRRENEARARAIARGEMEDTQEDT